jgi:hypothetical protein
MEDSGSDAMTPFSVAWDLFSAYGGGKYEFATGVIPVAELGHNSHVHFRGVRDDGSSVELGVSLRVWYRRDRILHPENPERWIGSGYLTVVGEEGSPECTFSADTVALRAEVDAEVAKVRAGRRSKCD